MPPDSRDPDATAPADSDGDGTGEPLEDLKTTPITDVDPGRTLPPGDGATTIDLDPIGDDDVEVSMDDEEAQAVEVDDEQPTIPLDDVTLDISEDDDEVFEIEEDDELGVPAAAVPGESRPVPVRAATVPPAIPERARSEPAPVPTPAPDELAPRQLEIEIPTVLDRYLDSADERTAGKRAEALEAELEEVEGPLAAELAYELGELYLRELEDEAKAVKAYGKALQVDPSLRANLWAIRRIFYRRGLWPNLVKLIGAEIRFVTTDLERADLEVEKGRLLEDRLGQPAEAKEAYRRAVAHDATYLPGLFALERRCLIEGDREGLAEVWRALAAAVESPDRRLVYLVDLARALAESGDAEGAFAALDEAAELDIDLALVARVRLQLALSGDDVDQQVRALDERMRARLAELGAAGLPAPAPRDPATPPDPAEAIRLEVVALRRRQAKLLRDSGDGEAAWLALEQALAAAPGEELVLSNLADLAEDLGKFDELAELVEGWQAGEVSPERAQALALRRVNALRRSGKVEQARALLSQLSATSPGYLPVVAAREADAIAEGDLIELSSIYAELAESAATGSLFGAGAGGARDAGAASVFHTAAAAAAQLCGDRTRAIALYMAALSEDGESAAALDGLLRCLEAERDHSAIADTLEGRADALDAAGRIRWANAERARGNWSKAAEILDAVVDELELDELLWQALTWERAGDPLRAAAVLERASERAGDPSAAAELLARAAHTLETAHPGRAAELYKKAVAARPEDPLARKLYHALLRRQRDWDGLAVALRDAASVGADPAETAALWGELAAILEERLKRPEDAAGAYAEMAGLAPDDPVAVAGLLRVSRGDALVDALERAAGASDPRLRLDALIRLARTQADADNLGAALEAAERAATAEVDAGLTTTVSDLVAIELAARTGEPESLARILEAASSRQGATLGSALLAAAAWERVLNLDDPDGAMPLFEQARDLDRGNRDALFGLLVCRSARGENAEAATAAANLASVLEGTRLSSALLRNSAAFAAVEGDDAEAATRWVAAAQRSPDDVASAIAATELAQNVDPAVAAVAWGRRAAATEGRARDRFQLARARALEAAGKLAEAGAVVLELCQRERPDPAALDLLVSIARVGGDQRTEAIALVAVADAGLGETAAVASLRRAAALFDEIGDPGSAAAVLNRLLELEPTAPELDRLLQICEAADDRAQLWELLSHRLEAEIDDAERAAILRRRATLRRKLGDDRGAARDFESSYQLDQQPATLLALANVQASYQPEAAADALRRYLATNPDESDRADAEVRLAEILAESTGDLAGAAAELGAAIRLRPDDVELRERHINLLLRAGDPRGAVAALEELAASRESAAERSRDQVRLATILRDEVGDRERAVLALDQARQLDPLNLDAVKHLVELVGGNAERMDAILNQVGDQIWRALEADPGARGLYQKLAAVASWRGETDRQHLALAAAAALGPRGVEPGEVAEAPSFSGGPIDRAVWSTLAPDPNSFLTELWSILAPAISALRDPEPSDVGLGRGDRAKGRQLSSRFPTLARMIERLTLDAEIYVGSDRKEWARVTSAERPAIYMSPDVAAADTPKLRFLLGSAVAMARDRTGTLEHLETTELKSLLAAAASVARIDPPPAALAGGDRKAVATAAEALDRAMSRRAHKELALLTSRFSEIGDLAGWRRASLASARRFGLALAGDLRAALALSTPGGAVQNDPDALDLIRFAASPEHVALREVLGYREDRP